MRNIIISLFATILISSGFSFAHEAASRFQLSNGRAKIVCEPHCPRRIAKDKLHYKLYAKVAQTMRQRQKAIFQPQLIEVHVITGPTCLRQRNPIETTWLYSLYQGRGKKLMCLTQRLDADTIAKVSSAVADLYYEKHILALRPPEIKGIQSEVLEEKKEQHVDTSISSPVQPPLPPQVPPPVPPPVQPSTSQLPALTVPQLNKVRVVCNKDCMPHFSEPGIIQIIADDLSYKLTQLEAAVGIPIRYSKKPVEVHLVPDETCVFHGYATGLPGMTFDVASADKPAVLCLNHPPSEIKNGRHAFLHETAHHYFPINAGEKLASMIEEFVISTSTLAQTLLSECHQLWPKTAPLTWKLCERGYKPPMLLRIIKDVATTYERQVSHSKYITEEEFTAILRNVIGKDVNDLFGK